MADARRGAVTVVPVPWGARGDRMLSANHVRRSNCAWQSAVQGARRQRRHQEAGVRRPPRRLPRAGGGSR